MLLPFMDNDQLLLPSRRHFQPEVRHSGHIKLSSLEQEHLYTILEHKLIFSGFIMVQNTLNDHFGCESIKGKSLCGLRNQAGALFANHFVPFV